MNRVPELSQLDQHLFNNAQPSNRVNVQDFGQMKINIDIPRSFFESLGIEQAIIELEALKREICSIANNRIQDAVRRKVAGNNELIDENNRLKIMIQNLRNSISGSDAQTKFLMNENSHLSNELKHSQDRNSCNCDQHQNHQ